MNSIKSSFVPSHTYEVNNNIIFSIAKVKTQIFGEDGTLSFNILSVSDQMITMQSLCSGVLKARKGINLPASTYGTNQVSIKDKFYLDFSSLKSYYLLKLLLLELLAANSLVVL